MELSQSLINQFVKLANPKDDDKKEVTVNGIYKKVDNIEYVQIEGSDIWTPVTSTVDAENNEKVKVLIKNHKATIIGNISSPSARSKTVTDLAGVVDEQGNTIRQMDNVITQQGNSITQIDNNIQQIDNTITQQENAINQQGNAILQIDNAIEQQGNDITQINNKINEQGNDITSLNNTIVQQGNIITQHNNDITEINNIIDIQGSEIESHGASIEIFDSDIRILNSGFIIEDGVLKGLSAIIVDSLHSTYADINFANISQAAITKVFSDSGIIKDLIVSEGKITGELVGVTIKGDIIQGNTVYADKLVIKGNNGLYYKLNIDGLNNMTSEEIDNLELLTQVPINWETNYTDYYILDNGYFTHIPKQFSILILEPEDWETNYSKYFIYSDNQYINVLSEYQLLTEEPEDWETNFNKYYVFNDTTEEYIPVKTVDDQAPEFELNTYYKAVAPTFVTNTFYEHIIPQFATDTYYTLNEEHKNGLNGTNIIAKSITAEKIAVDDLVAFDATIGGFHMTAHSIYSGTKSSVGNTNAGIYMDDTGHVYIGDLNNYLKFYEENGSWKLDVSASNIKFKTVDNVEMSLSDAISGVNTTISTNEGNRQAIMRYGLDEGATTGVLTIGLVTPGQTNYYTEIDNDEIRFVSVTTGNVKTIIGTLTNKKLDIDKVFTNELTLGQKFRFRILENNGMVLERV